MISRLLLGKIALIGVLTGVVFYPTFAWMATRFAEPESFYAHGVLIPFICAYLIWRNKDAARLAAGQSAAPGLVLVGACLLIHIIAFFFEVNFISGLCFLGVLAGMVWYNAGTSLLRVLSFPLFFLLFMIPLPNAMTLGIAFHMKLWAAAVACYIMKFFMPLVSSGSMVFLPNGVLTVGAPCSGLKSLITLLALSVLFTYLTQLPWRKRIMFLCIAVPVSLFANVLRIMLLILVFYVYGSDAAMGWFHDFSGMLVFVFALAGLFFVYQGFFDAQET